MPSMSSPEPTSYEIAARGVDLVVVDRGDEVDLHEVTGRGGAVDRDERAEAGAQLVELLLDLRVGDLGGVDGHRRCRRSPGGRTRGARRPRSRAAGRRRSPCRSATR